jgi:hypothetical protein
MTIKPARVICFLLSALAGLAALFAHGYVDHYYSSIEHWWVLPALIACAWICMAALYGTIASLFDMFDK